MNMLNLPAAFEDPYTVGVDIDGVLYELLPALRQRFNRLHGLPLDSMPEPGIYDLETAWNLPKGLLFTELVAGVKDRDIFWAGDVYQPGIEGLHALKQMGCRIVLISARDFPGIEDLCFEATESWLNSPEVNAPYDELVLATNKTDVHFDFLVDDYEKNVRAAHAAGRAGVLLDRCWNASVALEQASWTEIPALVEQHRNARLAA